MNVFASIMTLCRSWCASRQPGVVIMAWVLLGGAVNAADRTHADARDAVSNAPPAEVSIPQSVFDAESPTGRNPFFPHSALDQTKPADDSARPSFPEHVHLEGLSGTEDNRLAIINHRTLAVGETRVIKVDGEPVTVRLQAVKETSAVIIINGVTREIHLRDGL